MDLLTIIFKTLKQKKEHCFQLHILLSCLQSIIKPSKFTLSFESGQHSYYATQSISLQYLNPSSFRTNIRKFCLTIIIIIGC